MLHLWHRRPDGLQSTVVSGPVRLAEGELAPLLAPLSRRRGVVGALLVPDGLGRPLAHNGMPLPAGLHLLGHTDRFDFGDDTYWLSSSVDLASERYSPETHGGDMFCFITKARIGPGEEIIVCPGHEDRECGIIYKQQAWEMARAGSPNFRCPQCGFDPAAEQWKPALRPEDSLDRLFALAKQHVQMG